MVRTHKATQNETKKLPACHDSASLINFFRQPHNYTSFKDQVCIKGDHARRYQTARNTSSTFKRSLTSWTNTTQEGTTRCIFKEITFRATAKTSASSTATTKGNSRTSGNFLAIPTYFHIPATQTRYTQTQCYCSKRITVTPDCEMPITANA